MAPSKSLRSTRNAIPPTQYLSWCPAITRRHIRCRATVPRYRAPPVTPHILRSISAVPDPFVAPMCRVGILFPSSTILAFHFQAAILEVRTLSLTGCVWAIWLGNLVSLHLVTTQDLLYLLRRQITDPRLATATSAITHHRVHCAPPPLNSLSAAKVWGIATRFAIANDNAVMPKSFCRFIISNLLKICLEARLRASTYN